MIPQIFPNLSQFQSQQLKLSPETPLASGRKPYQAPFLTSLNIMTNCLLPPSTFSYGNQLVYNSNIVNAGRAEIQQMLLKNLGPNASLHLQSQLQGSNFFIGSPQLQNKSMPVFMGHLGLPGDKEVNSNVSLKKIDTSIPEASLLKEQDSEGQKSPCPPINPIASKKMYNISLLLFSSPH